MKRLLLAVLAGFGTWLVVVTLLNLLLRAALPGYVAAEHTLQFTVPMMLARLSIAALTSLIAGASVRAVAPARASAPWLLGVLLLVLFVPEHVRLWNHFPIWYHLTFLLTLAPLVAAGGALLRSRRLPAAAGGAVPG
jgi:hypothetical protein